MAAVLDMHWFTEARRRIDAARSKDDVPPLYRRAFSFVRESGLGNVSLRAYSGFARLDGGRVEGITAQLNRVFHPMPLGVPTGAARYGGGAQRGCLVDDQIARLVNHGEIPERGTMAEYTRKTLQQLRRDNLKPVCAQVAVWWPEINMATALDLVCIRPDGQLVNVQVKTGYDLNYFVTRGLMCSPFVDCPPLREMKDSHANRHMLQLVVEHMITQMGYGNRLADSILLIISQETHTIIHVSRDVALVHGVVQNLKLRNTRCELEVQLDAVKRSYAIRKIVRARKLNVKAPLKPKKAIKK
jgi:hypothetical protein